MSKGDRIAVLLKYVELKQLKRPDSEMLLRELMFLDAQYDCLRPKEIQEIEE